MDQERNTSSWNHYYIKAYISYNLWLISMTHKYDSPRHGFVDHFIWHSTINWTAAWHIIHNTSFKKRTPIEYWKCSFLRIKLRVTVNRYTNTGQSGLCPSICRSSLIPSLGRIYLDIFQGHIVLYLSSRYKINHTAVPHKA